MKLLFWKKEPRARRAGTGASVLRKMAKSEKKGNVGEISFLLKEYLKSSLRIKYEVTNQELIDEIKKGKMETGLKNDIIRFFARISEIEYKEEKISEEFTHAGNRLSCKSFGHSYPVSENII